MPAVTGEMARPQSLVWRSGVGEKAGQSRQENFIRAARAQAGLQYGLQNCATTWRKKKRGAVMKDRVYKKFLQNHKFVLKIL